MMVTDQPPPQMGQPPPQQHQHPFHEQAMAVCNFLLAALVKELKTASPRPLLFRWLIELIDSYPNLLAAIVRLQQEVETQQEAIRASVRSPVPGVEVEEAAEEAQRGVRELMRRIKILTRLNEILRQTYAAVIDRELSGEQCVSLSLVSHGRLMEAAKLKSGMKRDALEFESNARGVLVAETHPQM